MAETEKEKFKIAVYDTVGAIPTGKVTSYAEIARLAGYPGYHRLVGRVLHDAPPSLLLPCHRVLSSQGRLVPGWEPQSDLLRGEGVPLKRNGCVDMHEFGWKPMEMFDD